jgi:hypothetical protein
MVQGDGDHDLCTDSSYAEAMMMFTSTDVSVVEAIANLHRRKLVEVQGNGASDHNTSS